MVLEKVPVPDPSVVWLPEMVGLMDVLQQTPRAVTEAPPSAVTLDTPYFEPVVVDLDPFGDVDPLEAIRGGMAAADPNARLLVTVGGLVDLTLQHLAGTGELRGFVGGGLGALAGNQDIDIAAERGGGRHLVGHAGIGAVQVTDVGGLDLVGK